MSVFLSVLAAIFVLVNPGVAIFTMTTCEGNYVHRLSCDSGMIRVQTVLYGRGDSVTCSEDQSPHKTSNRDCSMAGALDIIRKRCDGKTVCELGLTDISGSGPDPCRGTYKYLQTTYNCLPAIRHVVCENSLAHLQCGEGLVILVQRAEYGRADRTTCSYQRYEPKLANVHCSHISTKVADSCNGKNSCVIRASNSLFGDPCSGIYKYLEVTYVCEYPARSTGSFSGLFYMPETRGQRYDRDDSDRD
ncbi:L-rhamnose-binding lectin SML-like [Xyrichtys novacula]|uniref:L-rhamnose-binding lectin SML-like n=1 Tax=Xyrichtys novacula TaxID=13765 RepID=A0AAV1F3Y1_XYRNO|nr:L-rhamnose-binding lectin SML-like [Xyrichtys novacula]